MAMRFGILGPIEVHRGGERLGLGGRRQLALLAYLLLHGNEPVTTDRLIDALWREGDAGGARKRAQVALGRLRRAFGAEQRLQTTPAGYLLEVRDGELDADVFRRRVEEGRQALDAGDPAAAADRLREALELWRGRPLGDVAGEDFAQVDIRLLEEERLVALEARVEADLRTGRHAEVVSELDALVARHPTRERLAEQLMLALYRCGRQADALATFARARARLTDELGLEPGPALSALQIAILEHASSLDPAHAPSPPASSAMPPAQREGPIELPVQPTALVGRRSELEEVAGLLRRHDVRLLTLTGPGGTGKTRLAVQLAAETRHAFPDGVFFVPLASLTDPALILPTIATTLGLDEATDESLAQHLGNRELLLLVDNVEQVVDGATALAGLLAAAPRIKLLVTSRTPLHVSGEQEYPVPPLAENEGLELFAARARAVQPSFALERHRTDVAEICRGVDCLPLAIELAAARIRILPPRALLGRLGARLALLSAGPRDVPERQRTIRATIDWSYGLLAPVEQELFARLGVFAGAPSLDAIERVCDPEGRLDALGVLGALVEKSLLRRLEDEGGEPRFSMLATIRDFALERLGAGGDADALRRRHAEYFLSLAGRDAPTRSGTVQRGWLARLDADHDDLRAALDWSVTAGELGPSLRLAEALSEYWYLRGHYTEGREWLERALAGGSPATTELRAGALTGAGRLAFLQCDYEQATQLLREGLALYRELRDVRGTASSLQALGSIARERGHYDDAVGFHEESRTLWDSLREPRGSARSLNYLAFVAWLRGEHAEAAELAQRTLQASRAMGDEEQVVWSLLNLTAAAHGQGEQRRARELVEEALGRSRAVGYKEGVAWSLNLLGLVARRGGRPQEAARALQESLALHRELGDRWRVASVLEALAALACDHREHESAARLLGAAEAIRDAIGTPVPPAEREQRARALHELCRALDDQTRSQAWSAGRASGLDVYAGNPVEPAPQR